MTEYNTTHDSIMAGTQVQEVKSRLRTVQEEFERRVAEIVGVEASGQGWDAPGYEEARDIIEDQFRPACEQIVAFAVNRVVKKVENARDATA